MRKRAVLVGYAEQSGYRNCLIERRPEDTPPAFNQFIFVEVARRLPNESPIPHLRCLNDPAVGQ